MFTIPLGMIKNRDLVTGPITNYMSSAASTGSNSFIIVNGYRGTLQSDTQLRGGGLDYRQSVIATPHEQILTTVTLNDIIKQSNDSITNGDISNIISTESNVYNGSTGAPWTMTGLVVSSTQNNTDDASQTFASMKYGWGFYTEISNSNINYITISKFHLRIVNDVGTLPETVRVWGKKNIGDSWTRVINYNPTFVNYPDIHFNTEKRGVHTGDTENSTLKIKYLRIFFEASPNVNKSTKMADFWIEGDGYQV